ncbi:translation initiation factor IF-2-like [Schistocerca nitens]|uniref:translation initiation factor IF-2-like n=1 Tax=Schistocerca nitens TaxID=7011 RepID=UPI00211749BD|nr:translation initiation factor IF-2-like [Schistocerca nitens]
MESIIASECETVGEEMNSGKRKRMKSTSKRELEHENRAPPAPGENLSVRRAGGGGGGAARLSHGAGDRKRRLESCTMTAAISRAIKGRPPEAGPRSPPTCRRLREFTGAARRTPEKNARGRAVRERAPRGAEWRSCRCSPRGARVCRQSPPAAAGGEQADANVWQPGAGPGAAPIGRRVAGDWRARPAGACRPAPGSGRWGRAAVRAGAERRGAAPACSSARATAGGRVRETRSRWQPALASASRRRRLRGPGWG